MAKNKANPKGKAREEFKIASDEILKKIKNIVKEGNVRKIIIKKNNGPVLMEIPLTFAIVGVALAPILAAVGTLAALATDYVIVIEREGD